MRFDSAKEGQCSIGLYCGVYGFSANCSAGDVEPMWIALSCLNFSLMKWYWYISTYTEYTEYSIYDVQ